MRDFPSESVAKWSVEEGRSLAEAVAGRDLPHYWWNEQVVQALRTPLLAIAIGARSVAGAPAPANRSALIADIAEQSLNAARVSRSSLIDSALIDIAIVTISTAKQFAASSLNRDLLSQITATPFIIERDGGLSFALPVIEQIYAARALIDNRVGIANVAAANEFARWRYVLALAVSLAEPIRSDSFIAQIVSMNPVGASWILKEVEAGGNERHEHDLMDQFPQLHHEIVVLDPDQLLSGEACSLLRRLRDAYLTWVQGLGSFGLQLARANAESVPGWTANSDGREMIIGRRRSPDGVDIRSIEMPALAYHNRSDLIVNHSRIETCPVPKGNLSRWTWSRNFLAVELKEKIKRFTLDSNPEGCLAVERSWHLSQLVAHEGVRGNHLPIAIDALLEKVDQQLARTASAVRAVFQVGGDYYTRDDLIWLRKRLVHHVSQGTSEMCRPAPIPDLTSNLWASSLYSASRTHELAIMILRNAAESYVDLVSRNFPSVGDVLSHMEISPMHFIGELVTSRDGEGDIIDGAPSLHYSIIKAPANISGPIVDITHSFYGEPGRSDVSYDEFKWWSTVGINIGATRPVTEWVYQWLIDDLAAVGWLEGRWQVNV